MKDDAYFEEQCIRSEVLAEGGMLTVKHDKVKLSNGQESYREYVIHPGAVVVVPILPNGHVLLERQFRYPLRQVFVELPAGKIDLGEDVLVTGQRELLEETGYSAQEWVKLGIQHPCIGYSNEVIHIYMATNMVAGQHERDVDEMLEVFDMPFAGCLKMIESGKITDSKTITALFLAEKYLAKHSD